MRRILLTIILVLIFCNACHSEDSKGYINKSLSNNQLDNLNSLARLYGYARYFYPNPHSMKYKELDWYKFLVYAIDYTIDEENDELLQEKLSQLFLPLIPELLFDNKNVSTTLSVSPFFYREHMGIGLRPIENIYTDSIVVAYSKDTPKIPTPDSLYIFKLSNSLTAYFPLTTSYNLEKKIDGQNKLEKEFKKINFKLFNQSVLKLLLGNKDKSWALFKDDKFRYADLIVRWNVIEHFYPYYIEDGLDKIWSDCLTQAFMDASSITGENEYYDVVARLHGHVKDSHMIVRPDAYVGGLAGGYLKSYYPPLKLSWCGDDIYISDVPDSLATILEYGDVLTSINGKKVHQLISEKRHCYSASTSQSMLELLTREGLLASYTKDSLFVITVLSSEGKEKEIEIKSSMNSYNYRYTDWNNKVKAQSYKEFLENIYYINLTGGNESLTDEGFQNKLLQIQQSKALVLDMRGYPNGELAEAIFSHLSNRSLVWGDFRHPYYRFPHQQHVEYRSEGEQLMDTVSEDKVIDIPVYMLINHEAMSYAETLIEIFKRNQLGTLVGMPTVGTNGDMTNVDLPCFGFSMTAIKDFSGYHSKGIKPDININPTLESIKEGRDYILEKTIELIEHK